MASCSDKVSKDESVPVCDACEGGVGEGRGRAGCAARGERVSMNGQAGTSTWCGVAYGVDWLEFVGGPTLDAVWG